MPRIDVVSIYLPFWTFRDKVVEREKHLSRYGKNGLWEDAVDLGANCTDYSISTFSLRINLLRGPANSL